MNLGLNNIFLNVSVLNNTDSGGIMVFASNGDCDSNVLSNIVAQNNGLYGGIGFDGGCDSNILTNIVASNNNGTGGGGQDYGIIFANAGGNNNILTNITANRNGDSGLFLIGNSNIVTNFIATGNPVAAVSFFGGSGNKLIYNNSFGEIRWTGNALDVSIAGELSFPGNIVISDNLVYVNASAFTGTNINKSANITLYGLPTSFVNPQILKDGVQCTNCYNFTSLNAGTVVFNVSSWSNYTIGGTVNDTTPPSVTILSPGNSTYNSLPVYFNVSLNENGGSVLYSLDNGANNYSMSSTDNRNYNASNSSISDGSYTFRVYANDTSGNKNYTEGRTFSFFNTQLTSCGNLTQANTIYTLQNNITNYAGTCFDIQADNVTLNGNGYTIDGDDSGLDYGVYLFERMNTTVKNVIVTDFYDGIFFQSSPNNTLSNITADSNGDIGVYLLSSPNNTLSNITSNSNGGGVFVISSNGNSLSNIVSN